MYIYVCVCVSFCPFLYKWNRLSVLSAFCKTECKCHMVMCINKSSEWEKVYRIIIWHRWPQFCSAKLWCMICESIMFTSAFTKCWKSRVFVLFVWKRRILFWPQAACTNHTLLNRLSSMWCARFGAWFIVTCMTCVSATLDFLYILVPYDVVHFNDDQLIGSYTQ